VEYGKFSKDRKEFIINRYDTPTPWINYLCNGKYCAITSQTGGGYSFYEDPRYQRITRYRYNNIPMDRPGRYVYLKDADSKKFWSINWQPVCKKPDEWECRHGLGYTKIKSVYDDILSEITYFVPIDDNLEIWHINVKNIGKKARNINLTAYTEFALFDAMEEFMFQPNLYYFSTAEFNKTDKCIYYDFYNKKKGYFARNFSKVFFSLTGSEINGFDCDREEFIGRYHSEADPQAILDGKHRNSIVIGGNAIGSLSTSVTLKSKESKDVTVLVGVELFDAAMPALKLIKKYDNEKTLLNEFGRLGKYWEDFLNNLQVDVPDEHVNAMINIWNQYQSKTTFDWSRFASLMYNTGTGRGIGFRDTSQDTIGVSHAIPCQVKDKIKLLAKNMYEDGHSYHLFFPTVEKGDPKKYSDDHLWIINAVYSYICETGDAGILNETCKYIEGSSGAIYEHLAKAIDYTMNNLGPHGFPRMFYADWNDCLNDIDKYGKGESIFVAMFLCWSLKQMEALAKCLDKNEDIKLFRKIYQDIKDKINEIAWDGEWYIRAFTDTGRPIGSKNSGEEGRIHLNSQSWAVLSGVADAGRAKKCMDSVNKHLDTEYGIKLVTPPYTSSPDDVGSLINYPPGIKENGAVFCHANTWAIIAECMLKRPENAYEYYDKLLPSKVSKKIGVGLYRVEPYVYSQFIFGPDHPQFGRGSHSWLTGTSTWMFHAFTQYILGIRPEIDGLIIDPCIPKTWDGFKALRKFRGAVYNIEVINKNHVSSGVKKMTVDEKDCKAQKPILFNDAKNHKILAYL